MSERMKFPDNVIRVDFNLKTAYSNPFEMFVDENSRDIDEFCKALLSSDQARDESV